jgi:cytochrome c oxidase subunit 2
VRARAARGPRRVPRARFTAVDFYTVGVSYRRSRLLRRVLLAAPLVTLAVIVLANPVTAASGLNPLLPDAVSPNGHNLFNLYNWISIPALLVFFLVEGLLLIVIVRDRRKRRGAGYRPPQWHGNTKLEIAWTIAPAVLLVLIGYFSFAELQTDFLVQGDTIAPSRGPTDLAISVEAHQFGWIYRYPQGFVVQSEGLNADASPMVVPTGKLVRLTLQSSDVIHGFWVPDLMGKTDLVPGYQNYAWFEVPQPGEWRGECTELCGVGHYTMQLRVRAVSPDDFATWVTDQQARTARANAPPSPSPSGAAATSARSAASPNPSPAGSARPSPSPS